MNRITKSQEIQYIIESVEKGMQEGYLELKKEDAITLSEILINKGYAVLLSGSSIGEDIRVTWIYAGTADNLNYADPDNILLLSKDYQWDILNALELYKEKAIQEEEEEEINGN